MSLQSSSALLAWMYRGSDYTYKVKILDENGDPEDLTGATLTLRLAHSYTDDASVLELTGSVSDALNGLASFEFDPADTRDLPAKAYDLTVIVTSAAGKTWPAIQGRFGIIAYNPGV